MSPTKGRLAGGGGLLLCHKVRLDDHCEISVKLLSVNKGKNLSMELCRKLNYHILSSKCQFFRNKHLFAVC